MPSINFRISDEHPALKKIRQGARAEGWALVEGLKDFCKERYNATLRIGKYGDPTSLKFASQEEYEAFISDINI